MDVTSKAKIRTNLWEGAFILTIAGLIVKVLSAFYRIPYQNIAGDIGFYIYQQIYPLYGIALVLSTFGFPVVISKIIADRDDQNDSDGIRKIIVISFCVLFILGFSGFLSLYLGAQYISRVMGDPELEILIKVVSFSFLLLPGISVLRGFFQGKKTMTPTAISQVTEQLIRVITILTFSYLLLSGGYGEYIAGAGAIFGSVTGGFAAIFILIYFFLSVKNKRESVQPKTKITSGMIVKQLLGQGFIICISGLILILVQLIDSFTLYSLLLDSGLEVNAAKAMKGVYDRGQPLIQLGTIVATSFSLTLVPLISSAKKRKDEMFIHKNANFSLRVSLVVGLGASIGLASIIEPTNIMLFQDNNGSSVLLLLSFSILFTSIILTIVPILQGIGRPGISAVIVIGGLGLKWWLNTLFIPEFQSMGAAWATLITFFVIALFHVIALRRSIGGAILSFLLIVKMLSAAAIMALFIKGYYSLISFIFSDFVEHRWFAVFSSLSGVLIGGTVYLIFILKTSIFTDEELSYIPMGDKLSSLRAIRARRSL
ncbi:putative polysaccharide biosynthesis protein [Litchfieldia alkalitelluris]|uniref:putative polysaccharide biosynthesis protein n=1 Tax=Litchfieldia alkalitelluris TaxID=304268 RepID=UPI000995E63C|nr:polysaccharide biosynthesis protein [Litchfieldia alkalitelluris]